MNKMNFYFFAIISTALVIQSSGVCRDESIWCPEMNKYGACQHHFRTRELCQRNCGICTPKCDNVTVDERRECGFVGITKKKCERRGCCYEEIQNNTNNRPWCYFPKDHCKFVEGHNRTECGFYGIKKSECLDKGCCWSPISNHQHPWCHHSRD